MRQLNSRTTALTWGVINSGELGRAYVVDHTGDLASGDGANNNVFYGMQYKR